jgi:ATP-dependent exoDNAse (exonuclease V) alpha subunit
LADGRLIDADEALHLDQGIAVTSHASQGKTVDQVIVSVPVSAFSQANEAQFYVSMSRARTAMHLYTDSKAALKEAVMWPSARVSPSELTRDIKGSCNGVPKEMTKPTVKTLEQQVMTR